MSVIDHTVELQSPQIGILISKKATGTNMQEIVGAISRGELKASIAVVVTEDLETRAAQKAKQFDLPLELLVPSKVRPEYSRNLAEILNGNRVSIALLEGFNAFLTHEYFQTFRGITLNIHPGLIPDRKDETILFPNGDPAPWNQGLLTEKAVERFIGLPFAGASIHQVTEEADFGPVFKRVFIPVDPQDTVETLYSRLKLAESRALIDTLKNFAKQSKNNQGQK